MRARPRRAALQVAIEPCLEGLDRRVTGLVPERCPEEAELVCERRGFPPLLLLDDVLSELDPERRRILADRLRTSGQALITSTSSAGLPAEPDQLVEVEAGEAGTVVR